MKEALSFSETLVLTRATWRYNPEDTILNNVTVRHPLALVEDVICKGNLEDAALVLISCGCTDVPFIIEERVTF
jgi:hypothetical protein